MGSSRQYRLLNRAGPSLHYTQLRGSSYGPFGKEIVNIL